MTLTVFKIRRDVIADLRRRSAQVYDDLEREVAGVRGHPHSYFAKPNVETFITYLQGYDAALHGMPLEGLFYWLELKWNAGGNPRHWVISLQLVARHQAKPSRSQLHVLDAACAILQRFFKYRRSYGTANLAKAYMERPGRRRRDLRAQRILQLEIDAVAPSNRSPDRTRSPSSAKLMRLRTRRSTQPLGT